MKTNIVWLAGLLLAQVGCSNVERMDTAGVKSEMEGYKIKRVSAAQIVEQVEIMGSQIAGGLTADLEKQIKNASPARVEEICQLKNMRVVDSVSAKYNLKVRLLGQPDIGSNNSLYAKEKEVLEAYADIAAQNMALSNNIQPIGDTLFVYTAPIAASKGAGKLCFSDDSGFAIWSIILKKSEVIKNIKPQK